MADYGLKISQEGYDVTTAPVTKLVMSSKFNLLKTKASGIAPGNVPHGLPYIPIFFVIRKSSGKYGTVGDSTASCGTYELTMTAGWRYYIFYQQGVE